MSSDRERNDWRTAIRLEKNPPSLHRLDMALRVGRVRYERDLVQLQLRLKKVALAYRAQNLRGVIVFEGGDAAGKGGAIRRISWPLDPRNLKVWQIAAPTQDEKGQHYLYRFWKRLPRPGQLVIFDRSWYGRVLVERIEGFAAEAEWRRAYAEINEFERLLTDDGIRVVKLYLHITKDEQLHRFRSRLEDPLKRWKLSEEDLRNRSRWPQYEVAVEEMFSKTSTVSCPWSVIPANDKKFARLAAMRASVERLGHGVDLVLPGLEPGFERELRVTLDRESEAG